MSEVLTVPTHFENVSDLSQGLVDRVDAEKLILYGPMAYDEGIEVGFSVLLLDGTPALEGVGRVAAAVDGGDERAPETRYDIVFDTLQLDGRSEVVYERIVLARQTLLGVEPPTGEVDVSAVDEIEQAAEAYESPPYDDEQIAHAADVSLAASSVSEADGPHIVDEVPGELGYADIASGDVDVADVQMIHSESPATDDSAEYSPVEYAAEEIPAVSASTEEIAPHEGEDLRYHVDRPDIPLGRPTVASSWRPSADARPEPRASSGMFLYDGPLPIPAQPPRPDLDPSLRVAPAPRPSSGEPATAEVDMGAVAEFAQDEERDLGQSHDLEVVDEEYVSVQDHTDED